MKREFNFLLVIVISFVTIMSVVGCGGTPKASADLELQKKTEESMQEGNRQLGMPGIINFQEKKNLKWIYELCDKADLICHAYIYNEYHDKFIYLGKCAGFGIPYSAQFSNSQKIVEADRYLGKDWSGLYPIAIPQPEPNGLFKPEGLAATWLIMFDPKTKEPKPCYWEPEIIVLPFKMT